MRGRSLKNYDLYLQKIKLYAKTLDIEIIKGEVAGEAVWIPSKRRIKVDDDLNESTEIACLLHELGHSTDDQLIKNHRSLNKAYNKCYTQVITPKELELVVACEKRAWDIGKAIAAQLRIPLGKWYAKERINGIRAYENN